MNASSNEVNSLTVLNAQCMVMDMLLDAIRHHARSSPQPARLPRRLTNSSRSRGSSSP